MHRAANSAWTLQNTGATCKYIYAQEKGVQGKNNAHAWIRIVDP